MQSGLTLWIKDINDVIFLMLMVVEIDFYVTTGK
jgi:hypothetical protein